jgi:hypothetical protein
MRAPRNFTLTAAMVARRSPQRSFWQPFSTLRLSSAVATLLFILVFLGDYLSGGYGAAPLAFAPKLALERQSPEAAEPFNDQTNQFAASTEVPALDEQPLAKALLAPESTETPAAMPTLLASQPYPLPPSLAAGLAPSTTVTESLRIAAAPTNAAGDVQPYDSTLEGYPPSEAPPAALGATAETEPTLPTVGAVTPAEEPAAAPFWTFWRVMEASLAVLAVVTGLAAFFLRRSTNP